MSSTPEAHSSGVIDSKAGVGLREPSLKIAEAQLIGWGGGDPIPCTVHDIAESGIFIHASDVPELCVGRRYEVVVDAKNEIAVGDRGLVASIGEGCYATVIRTEVVEGGQMVGAGLRFDQPLVI